MNNSAKKVIFIIVIVLILFGIIWLVYDLVKKEPADTKTDNTNFADENTGLDNIINELFDNVTENENVEIDIKNDGNNVNEIGQNDTVEQNKVNQSSSTESVTSKEQKAIELVKKQWGDTNGVYFSNMSIDSQGRYIVSVNDKRSTKTLAFFVVDVEKGTVTKQ